MDKKIDIQVDANVTPAQEKIKNLGNTIKEQVNHGKSAFGELGDSVESEMGRLEKGVRSKMEKIGEYMVAAFAVEKIVDELKDLSKEAVKSFSEVEDAAYDLSEAISSIGDASEEAKKSVEVLSDGADQLSDSFKNIFRADEFKKLESSLVRAKVPLDKIKQTAEAVASFALDHPGMGLEEAGNQIVAALTGKVPAALKEVGLNIGQTESSASALGKVLDKFPYSLNKVDAASKLVTNQMIIQKNTTKDLSVALGSSLSKYTTIGETLKQQAYLFLTHPIDYLSGSISKLAEDTADDMVKVGDSEKRMSDAILEDSGRKLKVVGSDEHNLTDLSDKELENRLNAAKDFDNEYKDLKGKLVTDMENFGKRDFEREIERIKKLQEARKKANAELLAAQKKFDEQLGKIKEEQDTFDLEQSMRTGDKRVDEENVRFAKQQEKLKIEQDELINIIKNGTKAQADAAQKEWDKNLLVMESDTSQHAKNIAAILLEEQEEAQKKWDEALKKMGEEQYKHEKSGTSVKDTRNDIKLEEGKESPVAHENERFKNEKEDLQDQQDDLLITHQQYLDKMKEAEANHDLNIAGLRKKQLAEEKKDIKEGLDAAIDGYVQQAQAQQAANEFRIQQEQSQIGAEEAMAQAGLKNDLAFEEKRQAALEAQQIKLQEQQRKAKELEVFLNAVASFSKDNAATAMPLALATLAAMRATEAQFEHGGIVERPGAGGSVQGGVFFGRRHSQGGIHIEAEAGEGILSRRDMAAIGGPAGFRELRSAIHDGVPVGAATMDTSGIERKLDSLERTLKNLPITTITADTVGHIIETRTEGLRKDIIKHVPKQWSR